MANVSNNEIRFLNPPTVEVRKKKYCRFKKAGIKYVDYKDPEVPQRAGKDSSSPHHRYFIEVPAQGSTGCKACTLTRTSPICN